jgi:hypothetical protein
MADRIDFAVFDSTGAPKTDALANGLAFVDYRDRLGSARSAPAITHIGGGVYGFTPTDSDLSTGTVYLVSTGTGGFPSRYAGGIFLDSAPFGVFLLTDATGSLWAGASPTFGIYKDFFGANRSAPTFTAVAGAYLWIATPSAGDIATGSAYRFDAPALAYPSYYSGVFFANSGGVIPPPTTGLYDGSFAIPFIAVAQPPTIIAAEPLDGTHLRVIFSESVMDVDALIAANYVITGGGGLTVSAVVKESDRFYVLTTSEQIPGQSYTITVNNIRDQKQNPV